MDLDSFLFFATVVEAGSFIEAGRRLGIDRSNVSRRVRNLEQDLGAHLVRRTTRHMTLTETGTLLYERCVVIRTEVDEARKAVSNLHATVRGPVHLSCPPMIGRRIFAPLLAEFCLRHPEVTLQVKLKNDVLDLVGEGVDVALRLTHEPGGNLVARELARVDWILCASPKYLRTHGTPAWPEDLAQHAWLGQRGRMALEMLRGSEHRSVVVTTRLECADFTFLREAAIAGLGIGLMPAYIATEALRRGRLKTVLADFRLLSSPGDRLYAITLATRYMPPQVRALLEFLKGKFAQGPPWLDARGSPSSRVARKKSKRP